MRSINESLTRLRKIVDFDYVIDCYSGPQNRKLKFMEYVLITRAFMKFIYAIAFNRLLPSLFYDTFYPKKHVFRRDRDYGNLHQKGHQNIVKVSSVLELKKLLEKANRSLTPVHLCGSTHSSRGVTLARHGGLRVLLKGIPPSFAMIDDEVAEVSAFATLGRVAHFIAKHSRMLPVFGDQLGLTVGGYLSAGGVGFNSTEYGFLADHVLKIRLLTAQGEILDCSPDIHPDIFSGVLGGQGQLGVILSAQIRTIPRKEVYIRLDVVNLRGKEHLLSILGQTHDKKWNYAFADLFMSDGRLKLAYYAGRDSNKENDILSFDKEFDDIVGTDKATLRPSHLSRWKYNRPVMPLGYSVPTILTDGWMSNAYCLEFSAFGELLPELISLLNEPQASVTIYDMAPPLITNARYHSFLPFRQSEKSKEFMVFFAIFYTYCGMGEREKEEIKKIVDCMFHRIVDAGGKPYLEGYHPSMSRETLRQIYPQYDDFLSLKAKLDPNKILHPDGIES
jgi:FAD/FMN-containing dehydrogenase